MPGTSACCDRAQGVEDMCLLVGRVPVDDRAYDRAWQVQEVREQTESECRPFRGSRDHRPCGAKQASPTFCAPATPFPTGIPPSPAEHRARSCTRSATSPRRGHPPPVASQAVSASSILVTRSNTNPQVIDPGVACCPGRWAGRDHDRTIRAWPAARGPGIGHHEGHESPTAPTGPGVPGLGDGVDEEQPAPCASAASGCRSLTFTGHPGLCTPTRSVAPSRHHSTRTGSHSQPVSTWIRVIRCRYPPCAVSGPTAGRLRSPPLPLPRPGNRERNARTAPTTATARKATILYSATTRPRSATGRNRSSRPTGRYRSSPLTRPNRRIPQTAPIPLSRSTAQSPATTRTALNQMRHVGLTVRTVLS